MSEQLYKQPSVEELQQEFDRFVTEWNGFLQFLGVSANLGKEYFIHKKNLFEVVRRCQKRYAYMQLLSGMKELNECKKVAIEAFWINTLKPFMVVEEKLPVYNSPNEMFSLYRILAVIRGMYLEVNPGKPFIYPSKERVSDILYDFKYCNLNREAFIAFVETFADTYGVGISRILDKEQI